MRLCILTKDKYVFLVLLVPSDEEVKVNRILDGKFLRERGNTTFSVNFTWTGPLFNFTLHAYEITYELTGYGANETIVHGNVVCILILILFFGNSHAFEMIKLVTLNERMFNPNALQQDR